MGGGLGGEGAGGARVLPCQLHELLHGGVLGGGPPGGSLQGAAAMLLQHRGDGGGRGAVEEGRLH